MAVPRRNFQYRNIPPVIAHYDLSRIAFVLVAVKYYVDLCLALDNVVRGYDCGSIGI
jgi:hypothetical protein